MAARCACGLEAVIRTSWTNRNPGRRFYGCPTLVCVLDDDRLRCVALMNLLFVGHSIVVLILCFVIMGLLNRNKARRGDICGYHGNFDLKSEANSSSGRVSERRTGGRCFVAMDSYQRFINGKDLLGTGGFLDIMLGLISVACLSRWISENKIFILEIMVLK
ncbi:hypothetical protein Tco_0344437, partial [Tanacetum coccineum]